MRGIMKPTCILENPNYMRSKWEYHQDPGYQNLLNFDTMLNEKMYLPFFNEKMYFRGQYCKLRKSIKELPENTLLISKSHIFRLGECLCIDYIEKKVNFWQSASIDIKEHAIKVSNLEKVMNGPNMLDIQKDPIAATYKLVIIFCVDMCIERTTSSKFILKNGKDGIPYNLEEWHKDEPHDYNMIAKRIEMVIARVCYYPKNPRFSLESSGSKK